MFSESVSLSGPQICLPHVWGHRDARSVHFMSLVPGFQSSRQLPALATTQAWPQPQRLTQWGLRASGVALARVRVPAVTAGGRRRKEETQGPSGRWSKYQLGPSWKRWLPQEDRDPAARRGRAARAAGAMPVLTSPAPARGHGLHQLALGRTASAQLLRKHFMSTF